MSQDAIAWGLTGIVYLLAFGMVWMTLKGLRTGIARGRNGRIATRDANPVQFKKNIAMTGFSAVVLMVFALALTVRMIVRGAA